MGDPGLTLPEEVVRTQGNSPGGGNDPVPCSMGCLLYRCVGGRVTRHVLLLTACMGWILQAPASLCPTGTTFFLWLILWDLPYDSSVSAPSQRWLYLIPPHGLRPWRDSAATMLCHRVWQTESTHRSPSRRNRATVCQDCYLLAPGPKQEEAVTTLGLVMFQSFLWPKRFLYGCSAQNVFR